MAVLLKPWLLRVHRWTTLVLAVPLIIVIVTGLILSFEPLAQRVPLPQPLTAESILGYLTTHDPDGKATGLTLRAYENTLTIAGAGPDGEVEIDLATGTESVDDGSFSWSEMFRTSRRMHETLLYDLGWLVTLTTFGMLLLTALGLAMGWPRLRNTLGGWHTVAAWVTLPLVIISPLTGLALVYGITFLPAQSGPRPERVPIAEAVRTIAAAGHDLSQMTSLRTRGGRLVARIFVEGGALKSFVVSRAGLTPQPTNWPRTIHEGNWSGVVAPALNILLSIVLVGLWATGLIIWAKRTFRRRQRRRDRPIVQPAE